MTETGTFSLGDITVTSPGTYLGSWTTGLDGILAMLAQLRFSYGSGGTNVRVFLQVSCDQGQTEVDIACALFGQESATVILNFSGLTSSLFSGSPPLAIQPTDGALSDNSAIDGVIGDRVRMKVVATGTYAGQTLISGRITVR